MLRIVVVLCLVGVAVSGPPVSRSRSEIEKFREYLEQTRTEGGVKLPSNPLSSAWANSGKYQGDILLDEEQIEDMISQFAAGRNAYIWPNTQWPSRTVVYEFATGHFNQNQINYMLEAMRVLAERTCIRFRQRNAGEFNYVRITGNSDGCYASVGYWASRGVHTMNIARGNLGTGCMHRIVIIHELLHVIGFFHMQSTYNRDDYVRINWGNIWPGMEHNFEKYGTHLVSNLGLPYEYDSCMHYGPYDFSVNGRTTIDALRSHTGVMGQTSYVTGYDLWRVDRLYNCVAWKTEKDYEPIHLEDVPISEVQEEINGVPEEIKEESNVIEK